MGNIVIIGFMGSGKTRLGRKIAQDRGMEFVDVDRRIIKKMNMSIMELYEKFGEPFYRALETTIFKEQMEDPAPKVISVGTTSPASEQNRKKIRELGTVLYIRGSFEVLKKRLEESSGGNSQARDEKIREYLDMYTPFYEEISDIIVDTGILEFEELVKLTEGRLDGKPDEMLEAKLAQGIEAAAKALPRKEKKAKPVIRTAVRKKTAGSDKKTVEK